MINIMEENIFDFVKSLTNKRGVDVILECSGAAKAANDGLLLIRKAGYFTQIGLFGKPIQIDFEKIATKEIKVTGSFGSVWTSWKKAIQLMSSGKVNTKALVSDVMPITEWKKHLRSSKAKRE